MFIRSVRTMLLGGALLFAFAVSSSAQTLGAGISFLEDSGTGVTVDYAKAYKTLSNDRALSWVGDFSFHHRGVGNDLFEGDDFSFNTVTAQGGMRMGGSAGDNLTWHVQGLIGIMRNTASVDAFDEVCDALDIDCDASDTGLVITPGAGIDYAFSDNKALRVQLDIPIRDNHSGTRFWVGLSMKLGN